MFKKYMLLLSSSILMMISCSSKKENIKSSNGVLLFEISKGACLGKCPVYEITVYDDGQILYKGIKNVDKVTSIQSKIDTKEVVKLQEALKNVYAMEHSYQMIRDKPETKIKYQSKIITFQSAGNNKDLKFINDFAKRINDTI